VNKTTKDVFVVIVIERNEEMTRFVSFFGFLLVVILNTFVGNDSFKCSINSLSKLFVKNKETILVGRQSEMLASGRCRQI